VQAAAQAVTFLSLFSEMALPSPSPFLVVSVIVVVMFKSLHLVHLAEICSLTRAF